MNRRIVWSRAAGAARVVTLAVLTLLAAIAVVADASAQVTAPPSPPPCSAAEHRQFDFWIGTWDVFGPAGKQVGTNRIERIADGCALLEQWTGHGNVTGKSLNIYDATDGRWHQTWVDNGGTLLMLVGGLVDRNMVMTMSGPAPADRKATVLQRITWMPAPDGSVRQLWESSSDDGRSWTVVFDGRYVRAR